MTISAETSPQKQHWWWRVANWFSHYELLWLALAAPLLLFPNRWTPLAAGLIILTWPARRVAAGSWTLRSPLNAPAFLILAAALMGALASADYALSEAKWWGIFLQVAIYFALLNSLHTEQHILRFTTLFMLIAIGVAILGFLGANWDIERFFFVPQSVYEHLPRINFGVPNSFLDPQKNGFGARQVGHTVGMLLPLAVTLLLFAKSWWLRLPAGLFVILGGLLLILSSALMGFFGALTGLALVAVWWRRWLLIPLILGLLGLGLIIWINDPQALLSRVLDIEDSLGLAVVLRLDMWSRALAMIRDMPITGIGLNTYPLVQSHFYIGHIIGPEVHAHQLWLQTALDLGLPGLLAFLWLLLAFAYTAVRGYRLSTSSQLQVLLVGLSASVLAFVAGGLIDVTTLGSKPVAALWAIFGLAAAILVHVQASTETQTVRSARNSSLLLVSLFILLTVVLPFVILPGIRARNWGLVQAHKAIYEARQTGILPADTATQAEAFLTNALAQDPDQPQILGTRGSLHAWQGNETEALVDFEQRVRLDREHPLQLYAPFLAWKLALNNQPLPHPNQSLQKIYSHWLNRFPDRAEHYLMMSLLAEQGSGENTKSDSWLNRGHEKGAQPLGLLKVMPDRPDNNNPVSYGED